MNPPIPATAPTSAPAPSRASRLVSLDLLRGYFILVIASVHLSYYPSLLGLFTGRGQLWSSEAEGFFFISGLILAMVRRRDMDGTKGWGRASAKLLQRAKVLYIAAIVTTLVYLAIAYVTTSLGIGGAKAGLETYGLLPVVGNVLALRYTYGWSDFLAYYAVFIALMPLVVWLYARRLWPVVLAATLGAWTMRWLGEFGSANPFLQWQVYFFLGSLFGYHWDAVQGAVGRMDPRLRTWAKRGVVVAAILIIVVSAVLVFIPELYASAPGGWWGSVIGAVLAASSNEAYNLMLVDGRVGLLRPLAFLVTITGAYVLVRRFERQLAATAGTFLIPFGRNSLYVYIVQGALIFAIPYFVAKGPFWRNTLMELAVLGLSYLAVRKRFLFRIIPR